MDSVSPAIASAPPTQPLNSTQSSPPPKSRGSSGHHPSLYLQWCSLGGAGGCNVEVNVRVRPFIAAWDAVGKDGGHKVMLGNQPNSLVLGQKGFQFHRVFGEQCDNSQVFEGCFADKVQQSCNGYNVTMFGAFPSLQLWL